MARGRSVTPLTAAEIQEKIELARRLVAIGGEQIKKAQLDFDLAKIGLKEVEDALLTRGFEGGGK
jgi:hypothetical protein